ncbi:type I pullulanase [Streptococcus plurextorum]|uniref:type I pullulanase n=1 Tax=Streptococcus plurextorum TaxID=456876 RepID=UPI0003F7D29E|nr:type I pullulanase [Streptococcus plurextorum]
MKTNTTIVHFHSKQGNYFELSLWCWQKDQMGQDAYFTLFDSFGVKATLSFPSDTYLGELSLLVKKNDWSSKTSDYNISRYHNLEKTEVWLVDGDEQVYYSRQAAVASPHYGRRQPRAFDMAVNSRAFDREWGFDGWLGIQYHHEATDFRLWAPTAQLVEVVLYSSTNTEASVASVHPMTRGQHRNPDRHKENNHGVWYLSLPGDYNFTAYSYRIHYRKRTFKDSRDPYAIAATADGKRSVIISSQDLVPEGFAVKHGKEAPWRVSNPNRAVICEMHIRDFSMSATSGVDEDKRGKFLGACQEGTKNQYGQATGFDYIKEMGYSYVQLQPVFDHHKTLLEDGSYAYNWGYDPENYNLPESSFSSNPDEPATSILELKKVIQAYHDAGIGVILDVVYNHTYSTGDSAFQLTVPDYYYRMNPDGTFQNGSGCGNETASEKEMFRKYMIDSLLYWVTEYGVDGFRFDLMGLHDVETMNAIRSALDQIDPNLLMYGEGWDMGTGLSPDKKAKKGNAQQLPGIGFFNDDTRNAIKGAEVYGDFKRGFVSGEATEDILAKGFLGSDELNPYLSPSQVINYVEAHDNYNLHDLMWALHPEDDEKIRKKRVALATAMNLTMQGVCFMQLGQEFMRTKLYPTGHDGQLTEADKERAMNSYNAPDQVNQVDWNLVTRHSDLVAEIKELIKLKQTLALLSLQTYSDIRDKVFVESADSNSGQLVVQMEDREKCSVIFNNHEKIFNISLIK